MNNALMPFQTQNFHMANTVIKSIQIYQHKHSDLMSGSIGVKTISGVHLKYA